MAENVTVTLADVLAAREVLGDLIRTTPMVHSRVLSEKLGTEVFLKCENLQRAGSFKIRGAYNRLARLSAAEKARGVVAASAGEQGKHAPHRAGAQQAKRDLRPQVCRLARQGRRLELVEHVLEPSDGARITADH